MSKQDFNNCVSQFMGRIDQSLLDLRSDLAEIKKDVSDLKAFKIRLLAISSTFGVLGGIIFAVAKAVLAK